MILQDVIADIFDHSTIKDLLSKGRVLGFCPTCQTLLHTDGKLPWCTTCYGEKPFVFPLFLIPLEQLSLDQALYVLNELRGDNVY